MRRALALGLLILGIAVSGPARAFGIFPTQPGYSLEGGLRWDAAPRTVVGPGTPDGVERSLDGGLRYSLQGGSYEAFRDSLNWGNFVPSVSAFQATVERAFAQWLVTDPATGLGTDLAFVADLGTEAVFDPFDGAEIDLFSADDGANWNPGDATGVKAEAYVDAASFGENNITLTSGTTGYAGAAIAGADLVFNSNATWTLPWFETILAHEIGHALGLDDVNRSSGPYGRFIDDNYDPTSVATASATLTNSFAALIDPYDPAASPLQSYYLNDSNTGFMSPGVYILMESPIDDPVFARAIKLTKDDFAGRQFLYPWVPVPEPGTLPLVTFGLAELRAKRNRALRT